MSDLLAVLFLVVICVASFGLIRGLDCLMEK